GQDGRNAPRPDPRCVRTAPITPARNGAVALTRSWPRGAELRSVSGSDGASEFRERGRDATMWSRIDAEFVVAAPNVLHERMAAHDDTGRALAFEAAHRSESRFQSAVIALDPVVRVLLRVMECRRDQLVDRSSQRR